VIELARAISCAETKAKQWPNGRNPEIAGLLSPAVKLEFRRLSTISA
jgi:hypothetical protein